MIIPVFNSPSPILSLGNQGGETRPRLFLWVHPTATAATQVLLQVEKSFLHNEGGCRDGSTETRGHDYTAQSYMRTSLYLSELCL